MKIILTLLFVTSLGAIGQAQSYPNFWADAPATVATTVQQLPARTGPTAQRFLSLDEAALRQALRRAPMENSAEALNKALVLSIPLPDGGNLHYQLVESPLMAPGLAARYPSIKSYLVMGLETPTHSGRISYSPLGFTGVFKTPDGDLFIEPYSLEGTRYYTAYYEKDVVVLPEDATTLSCGYNSDTHQHSPLEGLDIDHEESSAVEARGPLGPLSLRTYRMALACTGEYAQIHGGTKELVLASMNVALSIANAVFENEVAVRMILIENNDDIIFLNAATDPYENANVGGALLGQNTDAIVQAGNIPFNAFDIGHVFTGDCTDVGGVVNGQICTSGKARGVTCHSSSNIGAIIRRVMVHEVAHQFDVAHSWANCPGSEGQLASGSAYEPGSGTTIMSYAGSCGNQNIAFNSDLYYSVGSLEEFINYSRDGNGGTCATVVPTDNTEPVVSHNYTNGFYIPISTPFELVASATDEEDTGLTYCWEQFNLGPTTPIGEPMGTAPTFRSFPPSASPRRVFPRMSAIINNQMSEAEVLPTYTRNLTFRCTVRDNHPGAGASVWKPVSFEATSSAGPFLVSYPNDNFVIWTSGETREVTWDVANTTNNLVKCRYVNIKLSTDGGNTYPITLLANTPNDGSEAISVPNLNTSVARVRVEAADNIFFDISNANFRIQPATEPGFTFTPTPSAQRACLPEIVEISLSAQAQLDFSTPVQLEVIEGLPVGAVANFSINPMLPSEGSVLSIDLNNVNITGDLEIVIRGIAEGADTIYRSIYLTTTSNDFSDLQMLAPVDGASNIVLSTEFSWTAIPNAFAYDFELATSASFETSSIIDRKLNYTGTTYTSPILFEENQLYFWRIRPINECGTGPFKETFAFHTENAICSPFTATGLPINIPGSGPLPTIESNLFIPIQGIVSDINLPLIKANYQPVKSLRVSLISPAGTVVNLFDQNCGNTVNLRLGFDDQAPQNIICPPDDGIVFKPVQPLSAFNGEESFGNWKLRVKVVQSGFGAVGALEEWNMEFCAGITPNTPTIVVNDTLFVPPGQGNPVSQNLLEVQDGVSDPTQLQYTILAPPSHGVLYFIGEPVLMGGIFRQSSINAYNVVYIHNGDGSEFDSFNFLVENAEGGWIPTQRFIIKIDPDATVGTDEPVQQNGLLLYPNPTSSSLTMALMQAVSGEATLNVFNAQGQLVLTRQYDAFSQNTTVDVNSLANGVYVATLQTTSGVYSRKVMIQR
ncbi:MAG: T9SS type A sorting domain-containing protein [Saprospiraceae bacterium]|nr:T9SS type A sorting domain-containing protein [Saprospiraceae bacterium]